VNSQIGSGRGTTEKVLDQQVVLKRVNIELDTGNAGRNYAIRIGAKRG